MATTFTDTLPCTDCAATGLRARPGLPAWAVKLLPVSQRFVPCPACDGGGRVLDAEWFTRGV
jgi:hypothetical protein